MALKERFRRRAGTEKKKKGKKQPLAQAGRVSAKARAPRSANISQRMSLRKARGIMRFLYETGLRQKVDEIVNKGLQKVGDEEKKYLEQISGKQMSVEEQLDKELVFLGKLQSIRNKTSDEILEHAIMKSKSPESRKLRAHEVLDAYGRLLEEQLPKQARLPKELAEKSKTIPNNKLPDELRNKVSEAVSNRTGLKHMSGFLIGSNAIGLLTYGLLMSADKTTISLPGYVAFTAGASLMFGGYSSYFGVMAGKHLPRELKRLRTSEYKALGEIIKSDSPEIRSMARKYSHVYFKGNGDLVFLNVKPGYLSKAKQIFQRKRYRLPEDFGE